MKATLLSRSLGEHTVARLVSPPFKLSAKACLTFSYKLSTYDIYLYVYVEHMESRMAKSDTRTKLLFNIMYYRWEEISLNISGVGWRRLVFEATYTGEGVSNARQIAIDNVTLNEEPCKAKGICSI